MVDMRRAEVVSLLLLGLFTILVIIAPDGDSMGLATHDQYNQYSKHENRMTFSSGEVGVDDDAIYRVAKYSINGGGWMDFTLAGPQSNVNDDWLLDEASFNLPASLFDDPGEHYLAVYSCSRNTAYSANDPLGWDCHASTSKPNGNWQLYVINNGPSGCTAHSQCNDGDDCTEDSCNFNTGDCTNTPIPGCGGDPCDGVVCDDGDDCTDDYCLDGSCAYDTIPNCGGECDYDYECNDYDDCTEDSCNSNNDCVNTPIPGCGGDPCDGVYCNDGDDCTDDYCLDGSCAYDPIPGCGGDPCDGVVCDDGDDCTDDYCLDGSCAYDPIPGCGGVCTDGQTEYRICQVYSYQASTGHVTGFPAGYGEKQYTCNNDAWTASSDCELPDTPHVTDSRFGCGENSEPLRLTDADDVCSDLCMNGVQDSGEDGVDCGGVCDGVRECACLTDSECPSVTEYTAACTGMCTYTVNPANPDYVPSSIPADIPCHTEYDCPDFPCFYDPNCNQGVTPSVCLYERRNIDNAPECYLGPTDFCSSNSDCPYVDCHIQTCDDGSPRACSYFYEGDFYPSGCSADMPAGTFNCNSEDDCPYFEAYEGACNPATYECEYVWDTGYPCPSHDLCPNHCSDGVKDVDEQRIDCGGAHCGACTCTGSAWQACDITGSVPGGVGKELINCDAYGEWGAAVVECQFDRCSNAAHTYVDYDPATGGPACISLSDTVELCNNADDDGDGEVDEGCDDDEDIYADDGMICVGSFYSVGGLRADHLYPCENYAGDCDDTDAGVRPGSYVSPSCRYDCSAGDYGDCPAEPMDIAFLDPRGTTDHGILHYASGSPAYHNGYCTMIRGCEGSISYVVTDDAIPYACRCDNYWGCPEGGTVGPSCVMNIINNAQWVRYSAIVCSGCPVTSCAAVGGTTEYYSGIGSDVCVVYDGDFIEICDGQDNDGDGLSDEGCDDDNDGYADDSMICVGTFRGPLSGSYDCSTHDGDCLDEGFCDSNILQYIKGCALTTDRNACMHDPNCFWDISEAAATYPGSGC